MNLLPKQGFHNKFAYNQKKVRKTAIKNTYLYVFLMAVLYINSRRTTCIFDA